MTFIPDTTAPAAVPQDHLEPLLLAHLRSLGPARVELGVEFLDVASAPDGVRARMQDVASGRTRTVEARYVVGADGVRSRMREALGIAMRGPDRLAEGITALFRAPLWELVGPHRYGLYDLTHPGVTGIFLPAGQGDRWIYGTLRAPAEGPERDLSHGELEQRIRIGAGRSSLRPRLERMGGVAYGAQLADAFRRDSAFLVGDAAHRVSPRGATGMNTAIRGGHDLGWKLAWVLRGWAGAGLLDTYEAEQRPAAEHNVARSAAPDGSLADVNQGLHADLGGRLTHVWLPAPADRVSTLDLLGPGLTMFTGQAHEGWAAAAGAARGPQPVQVQPLAPITARALGLRPGGALLARPDGVPAGTWGADADPADVLDAAVTSLRAPEQLVGAG